MSGTSQTYLVEPVSECHDLESLRKRHALDWSVEVSPKLQHLGHQRHVRHGEIRVQVYPCDILSSF